MDNNQKGQSTLNRLDRAGIVCSGACALHCLAAPVIVLFSPALASYFENEWVHILLLLLIIPIAGIAFYRHKKAHGCIAPLRFGFIGGSLLVGALVCESVFAIEVEGLEIILTIFGSALLITGHLLNMQCLRRLVPKGL